MVGVLLNPNAAMYVAISIEVAGTASLIRLYLKISLGYTTFNL